MNFKARLLISFITFGIMGCSGPDFVKREDGAVIYHGETSTSRNMDESLGKFVHENDCIYFESADGARVVPILFDGVTFGGKDNPERGDLVLDQTYIVQGLTTRNPLLDTDGAKSLAATCGAPLAFAGAVLPEDAGVVPVLPPVPPEGLEDGS